MMQPSDTPPDGDFARYVEKLTRAAAMPYAQESLLTPTAPKAASSGPALMKPATSAGAPPRPPLEVSMTGVRLMTHLKWVFGLWVAAQALAVLVPGAGMLFLPALLAYGAWVILKVKRLSSGDWMQRLQDLARAAAEEATKNHPTKRK